MPSQPSPQRSPHCCISLDPAAVVNVIETDMTAAFRNDPQFSAQILSMHPVGRFGRSEEVAAAVLYLCSPLAGFVTGVALEPVMHFWGGERLT